LELFSDFQLKTNIEQDFLLVLEQQRTFSHPVTWPVITMCTMRPQCLWVN